MDKDAPRPRSSHRTKGVLSPARRVSAWVAAVLGLPILTWILQQVAEPIGLHNVLLLYLLAAVAVGVIGGVLPAVFTAVAGFLLANWFFTEPVHTLIVADPDHLVSILVFLLVALAVGLLVGISTKRSAEAQRARAQAEALAINISARRPISGTDQNGLVSGIREVFSLAAVSVLRRLASGWETLAWAGVQELKTPEQGSEVIELTPGTVLVLLDGKLTGDDRMVLRAFAAQIVSILEREDLEKEAAAAEAMLATDRLRTALLNAVSHDLRTPLATIKASLTSLLETGVDWSPVETRLFLEESVEQVGRLNRMVGRLLDASRVQAGAVHVFFRPVSLDEVVSAALAGLGQGAELVTVEISESLPPVATDSDLLERVVANLIENALNWSPPDEKVMVSASEIAPGTIALRISDRGPGLPSSVRDQIGQPFQAAGQLPAKKGVGLGLAVSKGLLDAMGNDLRIEDAPGGGTTMVIEFKSASLAEPATRVDPSAAHV